MALRYREKKRKKKVWEKETACEFNEKYKKDKKIKNYKMCV